MIPRTTTLTPGPLTSPLSARKTSSKIPVRTWSYSKISSSEIPRTTPLTPGDVPASGLPQRRCRSPLQKGKLPRRTQREPEVRWNSSTKIQRGPLISRRTPPTPRNSSSEIQRRTALTPRNPSSEIRWTRRKSFLAIPRLPTILEDPKEDAADTKESSSKIPRTTTLTPRNPSSMIPRTTTLTPGPLTSPLSARKTSSKIPIPSTTTLTPGPLTSPLAARKTSSKIPVRTWSYSKISSSMIPRTTTLTPGPLTSPLSARKTSSKIPSWRRGRYSGKSPPR
ncbi:uncharacterized protein [Penaeus vannamei]|uniref:uncharacterized protein n=1 Tax=Penaeus vannamei TaxID=6689 RepID=UPI00387F53E9